MSDDQGDAGLEAGAPTPVGSAEIRELRASVEELARRMGAGLREDLAQIRAIAAAAAERDVTDDVKALRAEVTALAARVGTEPFAADLAAVRADLARLASGDDIGARLDELARSVEARLGALATSEQVGRIAGDLRAHLADALGGFDGDALAAELAGLRAQLGGDRSLVEQLQDQLADVASGEVVGALWDEVRDLRDVVDTLGAAGAEPPPGPGVDEVLATLATLRAEVEGIGAGLAASTEPAADPAVVALRDDVAALADEIRALSDTVATVERNQLAAPGSPVTGTGDAQPSADLVGELTEELATLRAELVEGLVVEPSDALSTSLEALRAELDGLRSHLVEGGDQGASPAPVADVLATVHDGFAGLRADLDELRGLLASRPDARSDAGELLAIVHDDLAGLRADLEEMGTASAPAAAPDPAFAEAVGAVRDELHEVRERVEGVHARLEEAGPGAGQTPAASGVEVLADQIAALRDLVATELDGLRQAVTAEFDRLDRGAATAPAPGAPRPGESAGAVALDGATMEALRDEIRAAGAIGDQTVDALREELRALRRRISVKAAERVLDDDQLAQIADAVAARLADG